MVQRIAYAKVRRRKKAKRGPVEINKLPGPSVPLTFHRLSIFAFIYLTLAPLYVIISSFLLTQVAQLPSNEPWKLSHSPLFRGEKAVWDIYSRQVMLQLEPRWGRLVSSWYQRQTITAWLAGLSQTG